MPFSWQAAPGICLAEFLGMNDAEIRVWLDEQWRSVLDSQITEPDPEVDRLVDSKVVSIRYAVVTQILGKIADSNRSLLYLQSSSGEKGAWNARSFCDAVIVPWVSENQNVIGTSKEPYANKPLRRKKLELQMDDVRDKEKWRWLVEFFLELEVLSPNELKKAFRRILGALARKMERQSIKYPKLSRVSLPSLLDALGEFLNSSSAGLRPLAVTAALLKVLGEGFSLFLKVESQGLNEADAASGMPGDVMCYSEDNSLVLAVEVKERSLTLADVRASTTKALQADDQLSQFLFATQGIRSGDRTEIEAAMNRAWASGLNLYHTDILEITAAAFVLLHEDYRPRLLREIADELDRRGVHSHRLDWHEILTGIVVGGGR